MPSIIKTIASGLDDVWSESPTYSLNSTAEYVMGGYDSFSVEKYYFGLRFVDIDIAPSSIIDSATLKIVIYSQNGAINSDTYGDDVNNAAEWNSSDRPDQIIKTTAKKSITISSSGIKEWDVTDIIQEIINRPGWSSGNALRLAGFPSGTPAGNNSYRFRSYEYGSDYGELTINYRISLNESLNLYMCGIVDQTKILPLYINGYDSCIAENYIIKAWGKNDVGQCNVSGSYTDFSQVSAGWTFGVGLRDNGSIVVWGDNLYDQLNVPFPNSNFLMISAGAYHIAALKSDGSIVCWGKDDNNQCNIPSPNEDFIAVAAGDFFTLGLKSNGVITTWGSNLYGQLDVIEPNENFISISAGGDFGLGLKSSGAVTVWGDNTYGQLEVPAPNNDYIAIDGGGFHALALRPSGIIVGWGYNGWLQTSNIPTPNIDFVEINDGSRHCLAIKNDESIVAWGSYSDGELNIPYPTIRYINVGAGKYFSLGVHRLLGNDLYTEGHSIFSTSGDLFVDGHLDTFASGNLFIGGYEPHIASGDLFVFGYIGHATSGNLFVKGYVDTSGIPSPSLFIYGHTDYIASGSLFIHGNEDITTSNDLFLWGHKGTITSGSFVIHGHEDLTISGDLYTQGHIAINQSGNLFIHGHIDIGNSGDLFVHGHEIVLISGNLYIDGYVDQSSSGNLFVHGNEIVSTSDNLYTEGHEPFAASDNLFMSASEQINISGDLWIYGQDSIGASGDLFVGGLIDISGVSSPPLFIHGYAENIASGDLFAYGSGIIDESGNLNFLINGYEPKPALACPILDSTASIQIKDSLIRIYQSRIDALINQLGKNVYLEFDPIRDPCPNCEYDIIRKRSTGIYKSGGPRPFARGRKCPYCKGRGFRETAVNKCIKCLIKWNPRDAENFGVAISQIKGIVRLKTYLTEADDLMRAKTVIVNHDIVNQMKLRVRLIQGPIPVGLREDRYCISFWELV